MTGTNGFHPTLPETNGRTRIQPRWRPGESGNPGGRPKSFGGYIREQTADGRELVDFALAVLRGQKRAPIKQRLEAAAWLADRGFGRVPQQVTGEGGGAVVFTLTLGERE